MSGTSPVAAPATVPAASPLQYSTTSAHPGANLAAEAGAANSIRQPDAEPTTPVDPSTSPSSRRKVNIAVSRRLVPLLAVCRKAYKNLVLGQCNNCHDSRKPCNNARPCQRCIKRGMSSSCVNHRRKRRAAPLRQPAGSSVATSSTASSHVSLSRPGSSPSCRGRGCPLTFYYFVAAAQQHVSLGNSSMLSFPSPTSHTLSSPIANENVFDSSYFYNAL